MSDHIHVWEEIKDLPGTPFEICLLCGEVRERDTIKASSSNETIYLAIET